MDRARDLSLRGRPVQRGSLRRRPHPHGDVPDTTPPTTRPPAPSTAGGTGATSRLTAADNAGGSGVAYTEYSLDGGAWTEASSLSLPAFADTGDLLHTVLYRSADAAGNVEADRTFRVGIDTHKPSTRAPYAASVVRYRSATLRYKVLDPAPNGGTATVTIKIRNRGGTVVKTLGPIQGQDHRHAVHRQFTCKLKRGIYRFSVYATDTAGNAQNLPAGSNKLVVK